MGKSGDPRKRQRVTPQRRQTRRDVIDVSTHPDQPLVVLDVGGQVTGMSLATVDGLIMSLTNARREVAERG